MDPPGKKPWAGLGLGWHVMRWDGMGCIALQLSPVTQPSVAQSSQARRHIDASGMLYGSGG